MLANIALKLLAEMCEYCDVYILAARFPVRDMGRCLTANGLQMARVLLRQTPMDSSCTSALGQLTDTRG